jgi:hypothetical protein
MAFITGLLHLGTAVSGSAVVTPGDGLGYAPQIVDYDIPAGGVALNTADLIFGPVLGTGGAPWGTLSVFGLYDLDGHPVWPGTLTVPVTPVPGQLLFIPIGKLSLTVPFIPTPPIPPDNQLAYLVTNVVAAGTTQDTATALGGQNNIVTGGAAGGGVILDVISYGDQTVLNRWSDNALLVYPPDGDSIESFAVNAPVLVPVGGSAKFTTAFGSTQWFVS